MNGEVLFKGLAIAVILVVALLAFNRNELDKNWMKEPFFSHFADCRDHGIDNREHECPQTLGPFA